MKLQAFRITKARHAATAFTGEGARNAGGRWNSPGIAMIYTAGSMSLAMLEMLVHLQSPDLLERYVCFPLLFEPKLVESVDPSELPRNWRSSPSPAALRRMGDEWTIEARSAILAVPSALVPAEQNYLINPEHPDFKQIKFGARTALRFDPRLFRDRGR